MSKYNPIFYVENGKIGIRLGDENYPAPEEFIEEMNRDYRRLQDEKGDLENKILAMRERSADNVEKIIKYDCISRIIGDMY